MRLKITNCTIQTGGGDRITRKGNIHPKPIRLRKNQNVRITIPDSLYYKHTREEWMKLLMYREHPFYAYGNKDFIVTQNSKIVELDRPEPVLPALKTKREDRIDKFNRVLNRS